jgi:hypothetical protein
MITLTSPTSVKLENVHTRQEHHGEALVLAIDLNVSWKTGNRDLDMLHGQLRERLFGATPIEARDPSIDQTTLIFLSTNFPFIAFAKLKYPLKFDYEFSGMKVIVDYGLGGPKSDMVLSGAVTKNFRRHSHRGWLMRNHVDHLVQQGHRLADRRQAG